jgi:ABC-type Na+ transport system ATPase subunit NatA
MDAGKVIFEDSPKELKSKYHERNIENAFKRAVEKR